MARRRTKKETEEVAEVEEVAELEVTEEFTLKEEIEDVSDTNDQYESIMEEGLVDLDVTEVQAAIEAGEEIKEVEEVLEVKPKAGVAKSTPKRDERRNRTSVDTKVDATQILKDQKKKEANDAVVEQSRIDAIKLKEKQRMARVKPTISQVKKNNGIRTSTGLFSR